MRLGPGIQTPFILQVISSPPGGDCLFSVKPRLLDAKTQDFSQIAIGVRLVGEEEGRSLNGIFRGIPKATNVLSFPFVATKDGGYGYIGDLVLTVALVNHEAVELALAREQYWAHLYIHGFLHLLGYRHDTKQNTQRMRKWGEPDHARYRIFSLSSANMMGSGLGTRDISGVRSPFPYPNPYCAMSLEHEFQEVTS